METLTLPPAKAERFWSHVDKSGECWTWTRALSSAGYGRFAVNGYRWYAHRLSHTLAFGPIPGGLDIDHQCHNRACVNPDHLRAVSRKENLENQSGSHAGSTSGIRGVSWNKERCKWVAQVTHGGKVIFLGRFVSEQEAGRVAEKARNELFTNNDADRKVA